MRSATPPPKHRAGAQRTGGSGLQVSARSAEPHGSDGAGARAMAGQLTATPLGEPIKARARSSRSGTPEKLRTPRASTESGSPRQAASDARIATPANGISAKPRRRQSSSVASSVADKRRLFVAVERAGGRDGENDYQLLAAMDFLTSDPYVKVYHQEEMPQAGPEEASVAEWRRNRKSCCSNQIQPPLPRPERSAAMTAIGQSKVINGTRNPRWNFTCEHELSLRNGQASVGWLVVEVYDWDRVGDDEPMGRVVVNLSDVADDVEEDRWHKLTWMPGQVREEPQGEIQMRYLLSTATERGLDLADHNYLLESFDFVHLRETIGSMDNEWDVADRGRLQWRLSTLMQKAFSIFDVDGDGAITPVEMHHVMACFGEDLSVEEIGHMIAEAEGYEEKDEIALKLCSISVAQFTNMLSKNLSGYLESVRKGPKSPGQMRSSRKPRVTSEGVSLEKPEGSENRPALPAFMHEMRADYVRLADEKRLPGVFWLFLQRSMESLLHEAETHGAKEVHLFRRTAIQRSVDFSANCTVRNTDSTFSVTWDLLQVMLLCYVCVAVPYQSGFGISPDAWTGWWWFEVGIDLYFVVDILLNFRTPVIDNAGTLICGGKVMAMHYIKGWFLIDVVACASMLQYLYLNDDEAAGGVKSAKAAKALRMMRLAKLLRVARMKRVLERMGDRVMDILRPVSNIFGLLIGTAFAMHLTSCFWYLAGSGSDKNSGAENTGWVHETWLTPVNVSISQRYLKSLYGIMLGEFTTEPTRIEQIMGLLSVIVNGFIYGAVAAVLSSIMVMLRAPYAEYNAKMNRLDSWMRSKRSALSRSVRDQVRTFYDAKITSTDKIVIDETAIVDELQPAPIADEIVELLYADTINRVPLFAELPQNIIVKICLCLQPLPALTDKPVVLSGTTATEMYIVTKGRLQAWETSEQAPFRARCVTTNGVYFWANVFTGAADVPPSEEKTRVVPEGKALADETTRLAGESDDSEDNAEGIIDLRGQERQPQLKHRALNVPTGSKRVFGVVRANVLAQSKSKQAKVERTAQTTSRISEDFDIAVPSGARLGQLHLLEDEVVEVIEVRQGNVLGYINEGEFFGESSLLANGDVLPTHDRNVTAVVNCQLCYLQREDVLELCKDWPILQVTIDNFVSAREVKEEARRIFNEVDVSRDGSLSREELKSLLLAQQVPEDEIEGDVKTMDWRGDHKVSYEEFRRWWEKRSRRKKSTQITSLGNKSGEQVSQGLSTVQEQEGDGEHEGQEEQELQSDQGGITTVEARLDRLSLIPPDFAAKFEALQNQIQGVESKLSRLEESQAQFQVSIVDKLQEILDATQGS